MNGDTAFEAAVHAHRRASETLRSVWDDERARALRDEVLRPLDAALAQQLQARAQQADQFELAGQLNNLADEHLASLAESIKGCDEAERHAGAVLDGASSAVDAALGAARRSEQLCDEAWAELEQAVACGGKLPVSREALLEVGWEVAKVVAREGAKEAANQWLGQQLGDVAPGVDKLTQEGLVEQASDAATAAGNSIRAWWQRRRGR